MQGIQRMLSLIIIASLVALTKGHGCLTKVSGNGQIACGVNVDDPQGCSGTAGLTIRDLISRSGNNGDCATKDSQFSSPRQEQPPGCEATFNCDWCALEKVVVNPTLPGLGSKWWTGMPAAHWDNTNVHPKFPCMTKLSYGTKGTMSLKIGDMMETRFYVNADHSGLYQFQIACTRNEDNNLFEAITPWKALHHNKEGTELGPTRIVGYTKADTDAYFAKTTCTGAACDLRMNRDIQTSTSTFCTTQKPDECIVRDTFVIPSKITCTGDAIFRWVWNSAEGPETYANCVDINLSGGSPTIPPTTSPPTIPPPTLPGNPTNSPTITPQAPCPPNNYCLDSPTCCPRGTKCFQKDPYWASCAVTCVKGIHSNDPVLYQTPWTCAELGAGQVLSDPTSSPTNPPSITPIGNPTSSPTNRPMKICSCERGTAVPSNECTNNGANQCASCYDEQTPVKQQCPPSQAACLNGNCLGDPACCPEGEKCFQKDLYWASCGMTCLYLHLQTTGACTELGTGKFQNISWVPGDYSGAAIPAGIKFLLAIFLLLVINY